MNNEVINKLKVIQENIKNLNNNSIQRSIICVSKTFSIDKLMPLIDFGHVHFGENKVQETEMKWSEIRKTNKNIKIHMVGKLQTNKVKKAIHLFEFIHSLDSSKLADALNKAETENNKKISYFIQINIGNEIQKSGISTKDAKNFLNYCKFDKKLNVIGLMVIPPNDEHTEKYFEEVSKLNSELGLKHLSMGMSSDYEKAVKFNATFLRIGSGILGPRTFKKL